MKEEKYKLREAIAKKVFIKKRQEYFVSSSGEQVDWIFDFRKILLSAKMLDSICNIFWEKFGDNAPIQVGGIEVAAIPLVAGIIMKSKERGAPISGFFIRKSRKKEGLLSMIEGGINEEKIILVDDILNSGKSFIRQVEVLEALGKKVDTIFAILRFRDISYYSYFHDKGIKVESLFTLDDFADSLKLKNLVDKKEEPIPMPFKPEWYFKSEKPNYFYVVPKSAPVIDEGRLYFGSDSGNFWAINQDNGNVVWNHKVGFHAKGKYIFSSPAVFKDTVYFGAYDGNFYALNKETGRKEWVFMEADWIGSSPCVAEDLSMVFVGLEFGLWKKQGGIVALNSSSGEKKWEFRMPGLTHSSPAYSPKSGIVVCGCNDFSVYGFNAKTGELLWTFKTDGEVKESFAFDKKGDLVVFGSFDSYAYVLEQRTGKLVHKIKTDEAIYSTPLIRDNFAYVASLDKNLYCVNLDNGAIVWKFATSGRIFASPETIGDKVYIGSNDGRLYELDAKTGKNTAFFQATERITNKIAHNPKTGKIFLPTFANEIYCLSRKEN
ncbi:MAG: PQQ-binding-like beta-propeller repeat protein [Candidatus Paceibacterota bacterium]|jgi:orotate phosphoribosyltransferase